VTGAKLRRVGLTLATLAGVVACAGGTGAPEAGAGPPHAVETERLRRTMRELQSVLALRLPQELDIGRERALRSEEAARSARAIAAAAERIGRNPPSDLSAEDREAFQRLAETLQAHAASIAAEAGRLDPAQLERRFARIDATCDACHGRFQEGPGPLQSPGP
jgi:cytochrome c556